MRNKKIYEQRKSSFKEPPQLDHQHQKDQRVYWED